MPWQILSEQTDPIKVMLFYCIQSSTLICTWDDMYAIVFLLTLVLPPTPYILYTPHAKSNNTITHLHLSLTLIHTQPHRLAHVFHLVLSFLCLFFTSLYSQLCIDSIPANYPRCHSHYFPISIANLLHTFHFPPL